MHCSMGGRNGFESERLMSGSTLQSSRFQITSTGYCDGRMADRWVGEVKVDNELLSAIEPVRDGVV